MSYEDTLLACATADERLMVMTAENRAAIRSLPAALGDRFVDVGIAEQTMIRHGRRTRLARAHPGGARAGRLPHDASLRVHSHRRRHRTPSGKIGRRCARLSLRGQRPHPPGDRRHRVDARHPTHANLCPTDHHELETQLPAILASPDPAYVRYHAAPPSMAHAPFEFGKAEIAPKGATW